MKISLPFYICCFTGAVMAQTMDLPDLSLGSVPTSIPTPAAAPPVQIDQEIMKQVDPSVVSIQHERAGGTGFFISEDGYILSNGHVIIGADSEDPTRPARSITVILNDERKFSALVLGFSMDPDVALLKIDSQEKFTPVTFADSTKARVGQKSFAVGAPVGLRRTFTSGILSNVERTDLNTETIVFQTDAAINSGNSGGPLFDSNGHVLGINTYGSQGRNNLGFTIPIHVAEAMIDDFKTLGRFDRSHLPMFFSTELYDELAAALGIEKGILVTWVQPKSKAAKEGLKRGDIITHMNGKEVSARTHAELLNIDWEMTTMPVGTEVKLNVLRGKKGERKEHELTLVTESIGPLPRFGRHAGEIPECRYDTLGLGLKKLVPLHGVIHRLPPNVTGALVTRSGQNSVASRAKINVRDIITHVEGQRVTDLDAFVSAFDEALDQGIPAIEVTVARNKFTFKTAITPDYPMRNRTVLLISADQDSENVDLIYRELLAKGADIHVATPSKATIDRPFTDSGLSSDSDLTDLTSLPDTDFDLVLIAGGKGAKALWKNEDVLSIVRERLKEKELLAVVGEAALLPVYASDKPLKTKITMPRDLSSIGVSKGANYTGKDVEMDKKLLSTTGIERRIVRAFLNKANNAVFNQGVPETTAATAAPVSPTMP